MRRQEKRRGRGLTLPEVLTAMVVLIVVGGTIVSIYQTSIRTWRTGMLENMAQQKASWIVQRIAPDLRLGMKVEPGAPPFESSYIAVQLPHRIYDSTHQIHMNELVIDGATGRPKLVPGEWVVYFRGDANGNLSLTGDRIWRRLVAEDRVTILREEVIADGLVPNPYDASGERKPVFVYWPDIHFLNSVAVTVTVKESLGTRYAESTMSSELGLRNRGR